MLRDQPLVSILKGILTKDTPLYVQYYIIAQCNLACRMCNIVEANSDLVPAPLEEVEKIAKNLKKVGAGVVLLTGGEPFMHQNLSKIVEIMVRNGLSPRLQTAGLAKLEQLQECYDAGARHINISLDSLVEQKQDYVNGSKPGSWRAALRAISNTNKVFTSSKRLCALGCVLSRLNFREIPAMVEFATRIGWWLSLVPVHITSMNDPKNFRGTDDQFRFRKEDEAELDATLEKLVAMKKDNLLFDSESYLRSAFNYLKTGEVTWRKYNDNVCDSPNLYFAILPNGDWAVCCDHRYTGKLNLAQDNFAEVYRSKEFRKEVFKTTKACSGCNYGSYPEVTLLARDKKAMMERFSFFMGMKNPTVPQVSEDDLLALVKELREKYQIPDFKPNWQDIRPPATSQRYGGNKILSRADAIKEWHENKDALRQNAYQKVPFKKVG